MTHDQSMAVLLAAPAAPRSTAERREAEAHVADCSDCWETLALLHTLAKGAPPPGAEQARALYGCDSVREDLVELVGLGAVEIRERYPLTARHLSWCHPCGMRLAEVLAAERAAVRGELGPPVTSPARLQWRDTVSALGRRARELGETIVAQVREGVAIITTVPEGLFPIPVPALAGARRSAGGAPGATAGQRVEVPLDDGETVEVTVFSRPDGRVGVEVRLRPASAGARLISLREVRDDGEDLIGSQTPHGEAAVVFRDLPAGRYLLGIDAPPAGELRIPLTIASEG